MQFDIDNSRILRRKEIAECLAGTAETIKYHEDKYISLNEVRDILDSYLYATLDIDRFEPATSPEPVRFPWEMQNTKR